MPRSYAYALPQKMVLGALRSALSAKLAEQKLTVVDGWTLGFAQDQGPFARRSARLDGHTRTMLLVELAGNRNLELASRNLEGVKLVAPHGAAALRPAAARPAAALEGRRAAPRAKSLASAGAAAAATDRGDNRGGACRESTPGREGGGQGEESCRKRRRAKKPARRKSGGVKPRQCERRLPSQTPKAKE